MGGAIAVRMLKRLLGDVSLEKDYLPARPSTVHQDIKLQCIYSLRPAGIAAADSLALLGHEVEVFDDKPKPGGYLRTGGEDFTPPKKNT